MNLSYIKDEKCPDCGAPACREGVHASQDGRIRQHVNGRRWEFRTFGCGSEQQYDVNFDQVRMGGPQGGRPCPFSAERLALADKRKIALKKIRETIESVELDEEFRQFLINRLPEPL